MAGFPATLRALVIAACACATAACLDIPDPTQPVDIASRVKLAKDPYDGYWKARGPEIYIPGSPSIDYELRAWSRNQNFGNPAYAQLYVEVDLEHWFYLTQAHSAGIEYEVERIAQNEEYCSDYGCDYVETIGINMSVDQLHAIARSPGFNVRVTGKDGIVYFFVPAAYVRGFLTAIGQRPA